MAGSRLHKLASIIERLDGLIETQVVNKADIPFWYHIYKRYPPTVNPVYDQPVQTVPVKPIFYPEDKFRARLHASRVKVVTDLNGEGDGRVILGCLELFNKGFTMDTAIKKSSLFLSRRVQFSRRIKRRTTQEMA